MSEEKQLTIPLLLSEMEAQVLIAALNDLIKLVGLENGAQYASNLVLLSNKLQQTAQQVKLASEKPKAQSKAKAPAKAKTGPKAAPRGTRRAAKPKGK